MRPRGISPARRKLNRNNGSVRLLPAGFLLRIFEHPTLSGRLFMLDRHCIVVGRAFQKDVAIALIVDECRYGAQFLSPFTEYGRIID